MKKRFIICLLFTALLITSLSGCTSGSEFATKYVQGALDAVYLAQFDAEYLELLHDATAEDLQSAYLATLEERPDYFASYFDIAILTDEMRAELVELYREIYLHARYEVRGAEKTENGYLVEVVIEPIDIVQQVMEQDINGYVDDFRSRYDAGEFATLSEEEYETEWAAGLIQLFQDRLDRVGYLTSHAVMVTVEPDPAQGERSRIYQIPEADMAAVDDCIIAY